MYEILVVDDAEVADDSKLNLEAWVASALSAAGGEGPVRCETRVVVRGKESWEDALREAVEKSFAVVLADKNMPGPAEDGVEFIRLLRARGYEGYAYVYTGMHGQRKIDELTDSAPELLRRHGGGVIPRGDRAKVVDTIWGHLREGRDKGLAFFRVREARAFVEPSELEAALELLSDLYDFQLFWETPRPGNRREATFAEFALSLPDGARPESLAQWLATKGQLSPAARERFMGARDAGEWMESLKTLRKVLIDDRETG